MPRFNAFVPYCFTMSKIQILKATHNPETHRNQYKSTVSRCQRYKFWKQLTTYNMRTRYLFRLFHDVKDTNFESNSQLLSAIPFAWQNCFTMSKIQILKATHNFYWLTLLMKTTVSRCQRYKFWKQLTTVSLRRLLHLELFHDVKDTNFESNSQLSWFASYWTDNCFTMSKIQILKATHNNAGMAQLLYQTVSRCQRYKFWKQLTTVWRLSKYSSTLFHDVKDTNFESNSQLIEVVPTNGNDCFTMSKIQILKATHNFQRRAIPLPRLFHDVKDTNFESNSQLSSSPLIFSANCFTMSKIQILKATHNCF